MLSKCANPSCDAIFLRFSEGRVFVTEVEAGHQADAGGRHGRQREYYWLCDACSRKMTVILREGHQVQVVPLPASGIAAKAAS